MTELPSELKIIIDACSKASMTYFNDKNKTFLT
jgi:hypothetical protein